MYKLGDIMKYMSKEEFIAESNIEIIKEIMAKHNGYVTTKDLEMFDISRNYLTIMKKRKMIENISRGIYIDSSKIEDNYYVLSLSTPKVVYSHMTALYFHGLSIKAPDTILDITVPQKYNNPKLKVHNVFYVNEEKYNIGLTEIKTPFGNTIKVYDIERCICDIIRSKQRMDIEHVKYAIKEYLKRKDKNLIKLSEYSKEFGIKEKVMDFISMMYE